MPDPSKEPVRSRGSSRRGLLVLGGAAALVALLPPTIRRLMPRGALPPHPDVSGFVMGNGGEVSAPFDPFAGIATPDTKLIEPSEITADVVCQTLFRDSSRAASVPIAFFTDINCPYCRVIEGWLSKLPADKGSVTWHDTPLLGPSSVAGARAIGAARMQGAEEDVRKRLHRTRFQPDQAYLSSLAQGIGVPPEQFLQDMHNPFVELRIADSLGLAALFGVFGTPALIVGRVLVIGALPKDQFDVLLAREAQSPEDWPCPPAG